MTTVMVLQSLICRWIERIAIAIAWASVALMLVTVLIVVLRYGFNIGSIALQDSSLFLHGLVFMAGAAYTLQKDKHVRVDVFYRRWSAKTQAWVNLLGGVFLLFPVLIFISLSSSSFVANSWRMLETSPEAGGLPGFFILKTYLWLLCSLLLLQGIAELLKCIAVIAGKESAHG
ncbi:TRAP transporter small permease subunit [Neiella marina]|uniref:TRAP transporter small permease protein n=1 Tax=Neiella holothuriorum TaxID=2870530 RepID=A0ABS7EHI5_9GAMM|nr:TRAP transporter small permease subunit [Neiella holothuriorum]MBW8191785.1 TRAP transporter small permease subunit [Neiella holothuriorum]